MRRKKRELDLNNLNKKDGCTDIRRQNTSNYVTVQILMDLQRRKKSVVLAKIPSLPLTRHREREQ